MSLKTAFTSNMILNPIPLCPLIKCSGGPKLAVEFKSIVGFWSAFGQTLAVRLDLSLTMSKPE